MSEGWGEWVQAVVPQRGYLGGADDEMSAHMHWCSGLAVVGHMGHTAPNALKREACPIADENDGIGVSVVMMPEFKLIIRTEVAEVAECAAAFNEIGRLGVVDIARLRIRRSRRVVAQRIARGPEYFTQRVVEITAVLRDEGQIQGDGLAVMIGERVVEDIFRIRCIAVAVDYRRDDR